MNCKKIPYVLIIVVMLLSFTFTTVGADSPQPQGYGILDGDGDQILDELPTLSTPSEVERPDLSKFTLRPEGFNPSQTGPSVDATAPYPLYPDYDIVIGKIPTYYFAQNYGASKYKVEVWDYYKGEVAYTLKGNGNCSGSICSLTPTINLKTSGLDGKGYYAWWVRGKFGDFWGGWSNSTDFYVFANGFKSDFSTSKKWYSLGGSWPIISPGYVKIGGFPYSTTSIVEKEEFLDWYVYEVTMKRKNNYPHPNTLYFSAYPYFDGSGEWQRGYAFDYANDNTYMIRRIDSGVSTTLRGWTYTPHIKPFDWNKLTVWQDPPYLDFWINGQYLGWVSDETYTNGYAGIGFYRPDYSKSPLLVDSAKLTYSTGQPYLYGVDGFNHDPAFNLTTAAGDVIVKPDGGQ